MLHERHNEEVEEYTFDQLSGARLHMLLSSVYTRPLTRIPIQIKLIQVYVNTLIQIAIRVM